MERSDSRPTVENPEDTEKRTISGVEITVRSDFGEDLEENPDKQVTRSDAQNLLWELDIEFDIKDGNICFQEEEIPLWSDKKDVEASNYDGSAYLDFEKLKTAVEKVRNKPQEETQESTEVKDIAGKEINVIKKDFKLLDEERYPDSQVKLEDAKELLQELDVGFVDSSGDLNLEVEDIPIWSPKEEPSLRFVDFKKLKAAVEEAKKKSKTKKPEVL